MGKRGLISRHSYPSGGVGFGRDRIFVDAKLHFCPCKHWHKRASSSSVVPSASGAESPADLLADASGGFRGRRLHVVTRSRIRSGTDLRPARRPAESHLLDAASIADLLCSSRRRPRAATEDPRFCSLQPRSRVLAHRIPKAIDHHGRRALVPCDQVHTSAPYFVAPAASICFLPPCFFVLCLITAPRQLICLACNLYAFCIFFYF